MSLQEGVGYLTKGVFFFYWGGGGGNYFASVKFCSAEPLFFGQIESKIARIRSRENFMLPGNAWFFASNMSINAGINIRINLRLLSYSCSLDANSYASANTCAYACACA